MKSEYKGTKFLNLACGENFIINEKWLNFDFIKREGVNQINLLEKLPLDDQCVDVVYCSHFIEHIPEHMVSSFLTECFRVLKNNGALRVVLPDFEKMVREYIKMRDLKMENKAEFMMVSIIDQFVRKKPGGKLSHIIEESTKSDDQELKKYIAERCGDIFKKNNDNHPMNDRKLSTKIITMTYRKYISFVTALLPKSFRDQNVSKAEVGELHAWIYDSTILTKILSEIGFKNIEEVNYNYTTIREFPITLDVDTNDTPRKGQDSIFLEARK